MKKLTTEEFIEKAIAVHGLKYDYSSVNYTTALNKIKIICKKHGIFTQAPFSHLSGSQCPECSKRRFINTDIFIKDSKRIHSNKYTYTNTIYVNNNTKLVITCPIHGDFEQKPSHHLAGHGCSKCNKIGYSKTQFIEFCNSKNIIPTLYIIRCFSSSENFIKIGITTKSTHKRFSDIIKMPYSYEIVREIKGSPDFVYNKEKELHKLFKLYIYEPKISFCGSTECFTSEILDKIKCI